MDAKRLDEVEDLFHLARERVAEERAAFLDGACRGNLDLRAEVESLLAHGTQEGGARHALEDASRIERRGPLQEGPGAVIGPYKLLQTLGEGGFGVVYMAEQKAPVRRRVALKVIKLGMDTRQVIARFEAERQALALMDHPNIARVLDAGATQTGRPYFVMELVRGVPITEYCDKAEMATDERLRLFVLVCRAVQHAHQKGIVHRDLKPSNILVTLHDGVPVPKVIDFGIAKATNQELTEKTVFTEFHRFIGTPEYMSPEQAEMSGLDIDTRADVYSLGVLLYELLTGTTPVDPKRLRSAGYEEMQRILREEDPERPSTRLSTLRGDAEVVARRRREHPDDLARNLRGDLDSIVLKALEKDRSRRYETASAFALDVERHLRDEPVVASPPSRSYKLRKFVRRNRGPVAAAAGLVAVLGLGIAGTTAGFVRARRALAGEQAARADAERSGDAAREEAARQRALADFFQSSLISSGPWRFHGAAPARVVDLLDVAAARLTAGEMADQPANRAVLAFAIGIAYLERDRWEDALQHLRLAVEWLGDGSADPLTYSRAAHELVRIDSEAYFDFDVGADTEDLLARALALLQPLAGTGDLAVVEQLFEWAHVCFLRDRPAEASGLLRGVLESVRALGDPGRDPAAVPVPLLYPIPDPALVEFNLACAEARLGNWEAARRHYAGSARGLREIVARGDTAAAADWLERCQHPAIGLVMAVDPPLTELIELAVGRHEVRNLGTAETLWNAAWVLEDIQGGKRCYELMRETVAIAREFGENRLMLGSTLVDLAYFEWKRDRTEEVLELCREARPLLSATGARPLLRSVRLIVGCLLERIVAEPEAPGTADLVREVGELAREASDLAASADRLSSKLAWWHICGDLARMHRALAEAGNGAAHAALEREWNDRLRADLAPHLVAPLPWNSEPECADLASGILLLGDATPTELETARALAAQADEIAGGHRTRPVDALARALFRLGDLEGAVREARRARELSKTSEPVRGLGERLPRYEAALDAR